VKIISASHGGHSGDIMYGLALARHVARADSCLIDLYISSDRPCQLPPGMQHPNGLEVLMTPAAFGFLVPLLELQPYINRVLFAPDAQIPADALRLDPYRYVQGMNLGAGNLANYPGTVYGIALDVSEAWLSTRPVKPSWPVTVAMSKRYRNASIDYSFLARVDGVHFVGLPEEYEDFKERNRLPGLIYEKCASAVELAEAIRSARVFIGNQSMPFAVAEGLKVNRALEVCELAPNVVPTGAGGGTFIYQAGLINLLRNWGIPISQSSVRNVPPSYFLCLTG
jgi:hypothetical protein